MGTPNPLPARRLVKADEASAILNVSLRTFWGRVANGLVPRVDLGGRLIRFDTDDLERLIQASKSGGKA